MITVYHSTARARELSVLEKPKAGSWCHVVEPSADELTEVAELFDLNRDLLNDAIDVYEAPRVEIDGENTYVFTRYCHPEGQDVATEPLLIVYTANNIVTVMRKADTVLDQILQGTVQILTTQKTKTFLHIVEQINRSYRIQLTQVSKRVLQIRARLRRSEITNVEFVSFLELEEDLNEFLTALQPQSAVLISLKTGRYMKLYEDDLDLIEDLMLNTTELIEITKSRLRTLVNIRQAYDTIATNNLNKTFKRLTSIGIFLSIPMIAGGLWGMNVAVPFEDNKSAFWIIVMITSIVTYLTIRFFKKRNWL
jgi:magnesium transporter